MENTCHHHAIYIKNKWTLPEVNSNVLAWLFHPHGGKELPFYLAEGNPYIQLACETEILALVPISGIPRCSPFLVKKADPVLKFTPHPMTSPAVKGGPYVLPELWQQNEFPSSPWYAHESGSHPGNLDNRTLLFEKPIPIEVLALS